MAVAILGVQGSGKSYLAIYQYSKYLQEFPNTRLFTNINGINLPHDDLDIFFDIFKKSYTSYQADKEYVPLSSEKIYVIVDEAGMIFNKSDLLLTFLITQHRHYNIELILITQIEALIHYSYRIFDRIYKAFPPSKTAFNLLRYKLYSGEVRDDCVMESFTLKKDNNVFRLYNSGSILQTKSPFLKWIILIIVLLLLFVLMISFVKNQFFGSSESNVTKIVESNVTKIVESNVTKKDKFTEMITVLYDKESNQFQYNNNLYSYSDFKDKHKFIHEDDYGEIVVMNVLVEKGFK